MVRFACPIVCWFLLTLLGSLAVAAAAEPRTAPNALPWLQNFEQQLPGEAPAGWSYRWGQAGDDLVSISNIEAADGRQSLLLDRTVGEKAPMSGYGTAIPDIRDGTLVLTIHLFYTGPGNNAHFSLLLRDRKSPHTIVAALQAGDQALAFTGSAYRGKSGLGTFREKCWYRVRLWLPASGGRATTTATGRAALWEMTGPDTFTPVGNEVQLATITPPDGYGILELVTAPNKRDFRLYLDALSVDGR